MLVAGELIGTQATPEPASAGQWVPAPRPPRAQLVKVADQHRPIEYSTERLQARRLRS